ncbi:MAG: hypothetical protein EOP06_27410, partial [Proteobacteria bacterium]
MSKKMLNIVNPSALCSVLCLAILLSLATPKVFAAESIKGDHVQVSLIAPTQFGPNATTIGVSYVMEKGWHVYWKNPGDSGSAPKFKFSSNNSEVEKALWPIPMRLPIGQLTNIGYENTVILPFRIKTKSSQTMIEIEASLEWLVCSKEECVPGFGKLSLTRKASDKEIWKEADKAAIEHSLSLVPQTDWDRSPWKILSQKFTSGQVVVKVAGPQKPVPTLFPTDGTVVTPQEPQVSKKAGGLEYKFKLQAEKSHITSTGFVLSDGTKAWETKLSDTESSASVLNEQTASDRAAALQKVDSKPLAFQVDLVSYLVLLSLSFLGGIILNFMPCV